MYDKLNNYKNVALESIQKVYYVDHVSISTEAFDKIYHSFIIIMALFKKMFYLFF